MSHCCLLRALGKARHKDRQILAASLIDNNKEELQHRLLLPNRDVPIFRAWLCTPLGLILHPFVPCLVLAT